MEKCFQVWCVGLVGCFMCVVAVCCLLLWFGLFEVCLLLFWGGVCVLFVCVFFQQDEKRRDHQVDNLIRSFNKALEDKITLITYVRLPSLDFLDGKFCLAVGSTLNTLYELGPV